MVNWTAYPHDRRWQQAHPDTNVVTWHPGGQVPHIGIVVDRKLPGSDRSMVVHNLGAGPQMEDDLFRWRITGHYRYDGAAH
ncbi:MAG: DUF1287 domain-containing protein [Candidatus Acidiferrales bacterium]